MDYGGVDRRRTKKDLKRKRLVRAYKRGGQFRSQDVDEVSGEGKKGDDKTIKKGKKSRKY